MTSPVASENQSSLARRPVKDIYPVSRLVREARLLLDGSFPLLWVEGEISNLAMPGSGHIYFTLKDEAAQVRCAMFRNRNRNLRFTPENGQQVLLRVRVTIYETRGEFQLIVEHMEEAGSGALQRAYEALKDRLGKAGLFDTAHKKALPAMPATLGIVSSPDGAAVHDILSVIRRRFPAIDVVIYPVPVQGDAAPAAIATMIATAAARAECDVLIVGRGGGSLEDLWSFNDERVAQAIFDCPVPVISAVGHETDFSIADFVADIRAPTPSAAAELAVPDAGALRQTLQQKLQRLQRSMSHQLHSARRQIQFLQQRLPRPDRFIKLQQTQHRRQLQQLQTAMRRRLENQQQKVDYLAARLKHPSEQIAVHNRQLASLHQRLEQAFKSRLNQRYLAFNNLRRRFAAQRPVALIRQQQAYSGQLARQLHQCMQQRLQSSRRQLDQQIRTLSAVSPLNTLQRGYSITTREQGELIRDAAQISPGDVVEVRLQRGRLLCDIRETHDS